jgi:hypothetical protein
VVLVVGRRVCDVLTLEGRGDVDFEFASLEGAYGVLVLLREVYGVAAL